MHDIFTSSVTTNAYAGDAIEDTMMDEYDTNREFSKLILENEDMKKETFGIFEKDMYALLRSA